MSEQPSNECRLCSPPNNFPRRLPKLHQCFSFATLMWSGIHSFAWLLRGSLPKYTVCGCVLLLRCGLWFSRSPIFGCSYSKHTIRTPLWIISMWILISFSSSSIISWLLFGSQLNLLIGQARDPNLGSQLYRVLEKGPILNGYITESRDSIKLIQNDNSSSWPYFFLVHYVFEMDAFLANKKA